MDSGYRQSPYGADDRFGPISQLPHGAPLPPQHDPPGYYRGWPLANIAKRSAAALLDWGVFWFLVLFVLGFVAAGIGAIAGQRVGEVMGALLGAGAYGALFYNFGILQARTGQSWGKRLMGLRTVRMEDLRPAGKATLSLRPFFEAFEIFTGVAFVTASLSYYRQTLVDKFCGIVVLDERRAGMTLPWALPQEPDVYVEPPRPRRPPPAATACCSPGRGQQLVPAARRPGRDRRTRRGCLDPSRARGRRRRCRSPTTASRSTHAGALRGGDATQGT